VSNATTARKPRQRRQHERSVAVLIKPSPGQPDSYVRITQDGEPAHYWLSAIPSDWGRAFRLEKPGFEGDDSYDVCLEENGQSDSCTCKGNTYGGYCKHVDAVRALDRAGRLPAPPAYKPGHDSNIPF
jgi:hypothetical protein